MESNYFNYFTEIEDTFVRRRGKHVLLSPIDWALIETWKQTGVPLHVAVRAIDKAFDSHASKAQKRSVKTLLYCQEEVLAQHAEWLESQVGTAGTGTVEVVSVEDTVRSSSSPFSKAMLEKHLADLLASVKSVASSRAHEPELSETLGRVLQRLADLTEDMQACQTIDAQALEASLAGLELLLQESLTRQVSSAVADQVRTEATEQLRPYKARMSVEVYKQTLDCMLFQRLLEHYGLPRMSLFHI